MRSPVLSVLTLISACLTSSAIAGGCGSATDVPLGGPYGGTASVPGPSDSGSDAGGGVVIITSTTTTIGVTTVGTTTGVTTTTTTTTAGMTTQTTSETTTTTTTTTTSSSTTSSGTAPTWTYLYTTYLAAGSTPGTCDSHHHSECSSPSACFSWIGTGYNLSTGGNLFSWDSGGWMPTNGPSSEPQADTDFAAWVAAGSHNN